MEPRRPRNVVSVYLACILTCMFAAVLVNAQITSFPSDYQLYPRSLSTNKATIRVAGSVAQTSAYRKMKLYVYRDGNRINTYTTDLYYSNGKASYKFDVPITAEKRNYRFALYGTTRFSEIHIKTANNVVAGDAYIIQGQSNAVANQRTSSTTANNADDPSNSPNREFVRVYGSGSTSMSYTKAWFVGKGNAWYDVNGQVGQWGLRMGSNLVGATNIPVAIINGAMPGVPLSYFQRNDGSPKSTATNYGRLLTRIEEAGLKNSIRAVFWYQGESDNQGFLSPTQLTTQQYKDGFKSLQQDWKEDYPGLKNFYIVQIRHGCGIASPDNTVKIQEAQRQLDKESDEILTISSNNTQQLFENTGIEYCHYPFSGGYRLIGDWLSRIVQRDLFNQNQPLSIESPEPVSAGFSSFNGSGEANQVAVELKDQGTTFSIEGNPASDFRLDGGSYTIQSISLNNRTIYINFSRNPGTTGNPTGVTYRGHQGNPGPIIRNASGMGLINFENLTITGNTPPPSICADSFELANNVMRTAPSIYQNTTYSGSIQASGDEDWFTIYTWSFPYLKVSLWNLPADYDLYLYNTSGVLLASSTNSGTTPEVINYNDGPPNTIYKIKIVSKSGAFDPSVCYSHRHTGASMPIPANSPPYGSSTNQAEIGTAMETMLVNPQQINSLRMYPNPASQNVTIEFQAVERSKTTFSLIDMAGRIWMVEEANLATGPVQHRLSLPKLPKGNYIIKINHGDRIINRKLIVANQ